MDCKRTLSCTCPQCAAASAAFTVDDLKKFSSKIDYNDESAEGDDIARPAPTPQERKPRTARPRAVKPPAPGTYDSWYM